MRLQKIGFTSDVSTLNIFKAEAFCLISSEIDRLQNVDAKKRQQEAKRKQRRHR